MGGDGGHGGDEAAGAEDGAGGDPGGGVDEGFKLETEGFGLFDEFFAVGGGEGAEDAMGFGEPGDVVDPVDGEAFEGILAESAVHVFDEAGDFEVGDFGDEIHYFDGERAGPEDEDRLGHLPSAPNLLGNVADFVEGEVEVEREGEDA